MLALLLDIIEVPEVRHLLNCLCLSRANNCSVSHWSRSGPCLSSDAHALQPDEQDSRHER